MVGIQRGFYVELLVGKLNGAAVLGDEIGDFSWVIG